jgi:hypothetical protein
LLTYPDGSRKHINREERDSLVLSQSARQTAPERYLFIGKTRTLHSFRELSDFNFSGDFSLLRRFLAGSFVFELRGERKRELLETPEAMALRLSHASP